MDLFRRAGLHDFQMAVVLDERPHKIRPHFVQHLVIVAEKRNLGRPAFLGLGHQVRDGLGDAGEFGVLAFQHRAQVAPDVGVHQANDGDLVLARRPQRLGRRQHCRAQKFSS